jgi:DNA-binding MarR family transcriptional regulator
VGHDATRGPEEFILGQQPVYWYAGGCHVAPRFDYYIVYDLIVHYLLAYKLICARGYIDQQLVPHSGRARRVPKESKIAADPLALERQVCFALVVASRSVLSVYRPLLEPMGLTHPQYLVMLALWGESPLSVTEIGSLLLLDSPTLSPLLKRLEVAGFITRTRDGEDERQVNISLTARGRELRKAATMIPPAIVARLGIALPELESLHGALTMVIAAAQNAAATVK